MNFLDNIVASNLHIVGIVLVFLITACETKEETGQQHSDAVEIIAMHNPESDEHTFDISETEVESGWNRFSFINKTPYEHLTTFIKVENEEVSAEDWINDVSGSVQKFLDLYHQSDYGAEEARAAVEFVEWYGDWSFFGGPGLVSAGRTVQSTLYLDPGKYIIECYIRDEDGVIHSVKGMVTELVVTEGESGIEEPTADHEVSVSDLGLEVSGNPSAGNMRIKVNHEDRESLGYRNVNIARFREDTKPEQLYEWLNPYNKEGIVTPAPVEFVGGIGAMADGLKGYFSVSLEPGKYAWVSEYPVLTEDYDLEELGLVKTFTIE